jgi:Uma2 family endonuclease
MATRTRNRLPKTVPWQERSDLTLDDIEDLVQAGAFVGDDRRLELIDGRLVEMSPKGLRHENVRGELAFYLTRAAPAGLFVISEPQFNLADDLYVNPDILLHPRSIRTPDVRGPTSTLVIEISDSSLKSDLKTKSAIYAAHGVPEYWVINAWSLVTTVHRGPSAEGYATVAEVAENEPLVPLFVAALSVQLDRFGFNA